ncbi:hypothetical protein CANCADRAFT_57919 [Tortispora caseinolytica NRRL Y-17796]|uniref:Uncharacterized protein n=1 Tax=Tortispora caseinolytica NRRL Y-17796 TaxID=767744 RepID=A0A1E4TAM8_9ASCO|nr:hypothetical protein CANCADRAFT_57919 [Tortispora caseinolytica NRRL Y-17796]
MASIPQAGPDGYLYAVSLDQKVSRGIPFHQWDPAHSISATLRSQGFTPPDLEAAAKLYVPDTEPVKHVMNQASRQSALYIYEKQKRKKQIQAARDKARGLSRTDSIAESESSDNESAEMNMNKDSIIDLWKIPDIVVSDNSGPVSPPSWEYLLSQMQTSIADIHSCLSHFSSSPSSPSKNLFQLAERAVVVLHDINLAAGNPGLLPPPKYSTVQGPFISLAVRLSRFIGNCFYIASACIEWPLSTPRRYILPRNFARYALIGAPEELTLESDVVSRTKEFIHEARIISGRNARTSSVSTVSSTLSGLSLESQNDVIPVPSLRPIAVANPSAYSGFTGFSGPLWQNFSSVPLNEDLANIVAHHKSLIIGAADFFDESLTTLNAMLSEDEIGQEIIRRATAAFAASSESGLTYQFFFKTFGSHFAALTNFGTVLDSIDLSALIQKPTHSSAANLHSIDPMNSRKGSASTIGSGGSTQEPDFSHITPTLADFLEVRQEYFNSVADLAMASQTVLSGTWFNSTANVPVSYDTGGMPSSIYDPELSHIYEIDNNVLKRGVIARLREMTKEMNTLVSQVELSLQLLLEESKNQAQEIITQRYKSNHQLKGRSDRPEEVSLLFRESNKAAKILGLSVCRSFA